MPRIRRTTPPVRPPQPAPQPAVARTTTTTPTAPSSLTAPVALTTSDAQHAAGTKRLLETYFAPNDNPIQYDLACIKEIIDARRADPRSFGTDAENPYKIHFAVYNLRNPEVIKALAEAQHAGVDVQILIESDQLDPAKTWNTADEELRAAGLSFSPTHQGLTAEQKKELDFIGIAGSGLMHLKTRLFSRPDPAGGPPIEKVLTGSMNPGDEAAHNHETLHLITDPVLVERYKAKYQSVLDGTELANTWKADAPVNVLFTPTTKGPQPADQILKLIDQEREAIFLSVFSLRDFTGQQDRESLVQKLRAAKARGVEVVAITDRKQSDGIDSAGVRMMADDKTEDLLRAAGVPVYECINEAGPFNAMHNKSAVFGLTNMKVVTDAGNWTQAALGGRGRPARNDESVLFIDSKQLDENHTGQRYLSNFLQLLRKYEGQQVDGDPGAEALIARLQQHPAWPKVKVNFDVLAETYFGQDVYITGNHPALGDWTREGPGLKLKTDALTYPNWRADSSLELPFGTKLEFKIIKRDANTGRLEWDGRPNQLLVVDPGDRQNARAVDGQIRASERFQR